MRNGKANSFNSISIKSNILFLTLIKILTYVIPLITAPYLSKVFGPDGIGEYTYIFSVVSYFALAVNFGFAGYGVKVISAYRNNKQKYSNAFWSIVGTRTVLFIAAFSAYCCFLYILKKYGKNLSIDIYLALSLTIVANLLDISFLFQALENIRIISITNLFVRLVSLVSVFIFVKNSNDLLKYSIIQAVQFLLTAIIPWMFIGKVITKPEHLQIHFKMVTVDALYYFLPSLAVTLCSLVDKTMLGVIGSKSEVGFYEQADKIIIIAIGLLHTFAEVFAARIIYLIHKHEEKQATEKIVKMFELYALIGIPSIAGLFSVSPELILVFYGEKFLPSVRVLYFLIPIIAFKSISNALGNVYYSPRGLMWMTSAFYGAGLFVNIIMNSIFIPCFGSNGAALATFISELFIAFSFIAFSNNNIEFAKISKTTLIPIISSAIMILILIFIKHELYELSPMKKMIVEILAGIIIYGANVIILKEPLVMEEIKKVFHDT